MNNKTFIIIIINHINIVIFKIKKNSYFEIINKEKFDDYTAGFPC